MRREKAIAPCLHAFGGRLLSVARFLAPYKSLSEGVRLFGRGCRGDAQGGICGCLDLHKGGFRVALCDRRESQGAIRVSRTVRCRRVAPCDVRLLHEQCAAVARREVVSSFFPKNLRRGRSRRQNIIVSVYSCRPYTTSDDVLTRARNSRNLWRNVDISYYPLTAAWYIILSAYGKRNDTLGRA